MLTFLIGMMGGLLMVVCFVVGLLVGSTMKKTEKPEHEPITEKQHRQLVEQQEAFHDMLSYNINDAYGIGRINGGDT